MSVISNARPPTFKSGSWEDRSGFDLMYGPQVLQDQIEDIEKKIQSIEKNANLSDTQRLLAEQVEMSKWSTLTNMQTNIIKSIVDAQKAIVRNIS